MKKKIKLWFFIVLNFFIRVILINSKKKIIKLQNRLKKKIYFFFHYYFKKLNNLYFLPYKITVLKKYDWIWKRKHFIPDIFLYEYFKDYWKYLWYKNEVVPKKQIKHFIRLSSMDKKDHYMGNRVILDLACIDRKRSIFDPYKTPWNIPAFEQLDKNSRKEQKWYTLKNLNIGLKKPKKLWVKSKFLRNKRRNERLNLQNFRLKFKNFYERLLVYLKIWAYQEKKENYLTFKYKNYKNYTTIKTANILLKKTKSNYFLTLIDYETNNTILKISGGYAYKVGAAINKKRANNKKQKYKTTLLIKKKKKEFKKTSFFSLQYIFSQSILKLIELNYKKINLIIITKLKSHIYNSLYYNIVKNYSKKFKFQSIMLKLKNSHNGMRRKKIRRV